MLGGFSHISDEDAKGSLYFLKGFLDGTESHMIAKNRALDCGAGIGRVTKSVLSRNFKKVDLLEQNQDFLNEAKNNHLKNIASVNEFICAPLQSCALPPKTYNLVWIQWVIIYLLDADLIKFFKECKNSLTDDGVIILKENITREGFVLDREDASVTRSHEHLKLLFEASGLKVIKEKLQTNFPKELFLVRMYTLRPA